jgi:uncharacterized protein DUF5683/PEGA domain-containing protein
MTVRVAPLSLVLAIVLAGPALAKTTGSAGALTLMSRPSGASFRMVGEQEMFGQTPVTLGRGMAGRFQIYANEPGFERWHRTIVLDGVSSDTLWISLRRKSAFVAGGRSLLVPGWGQFYDDHPRRGLVFLISNLGAGGTVVVAQSRNRDRLSELAAAEAAYQASGTPAALAARNRASDRAISAHRLRTTAIGVLSGLWGLSILDAMVAVPHPSGAFTLGAAVGLGGGGRGGDAAAGLPIVVTLARVRF